MRGALRRAVWAGLLVGVVAAVLLAATAYIVRRPAFQKWLGEQLAMQLGPHVSIAAAHFAVWPMPAVRLSDVAVRLDTTTVPVATAAVVRCTIRVTPLLAGRLVIGAVTVEEPRISVERAADGTFPIRGLFAPFGAVAGGSGPSVAEQHPLPHIVVRNGEITFVDRSLSEAPAALHFTHLMLSMAAPDARNRTRLNLTGTLDTAGRISIEGAVSPVAGKSVLDATVDARVRATGLELETVRRYLPDNARELVAHGAINLSASLSGPVAGLAGDATLALPAGRLDWPPVGVDGPIQIATHFAVRRGALRLSQTNVQAQRIALPRFTAEQVSARLEYADRRLSVDELRFDALGGAWAPTGIVSFDGRPQITAEIHASNVESNQLLALLRDGAGDSADGSEKAELQASGAVDISASVSGTLPESLEGDATFRLSSGTVEWAALRFDGPLQLTSHFGVDDDAVRLSRGQFEAQAAHLARIDAEKISATFGYADRQLRVDELRFNAFAGTWRQSGTVAFESPRRFEVETHAYNVACRQLVDALTGDDMDPGFESCQGEGQFQGRWTGSESWLATLDGRGSMLLRGGTVPSSSIIEAIWSKLLPRLNPLRVFDAVRQPTTLDRLSQTFTLRDARLSTDNLLLVTSDYQLMGRGSAGLDGTLDFDTEVALTAAGIQKLIVMAALPLPTGGLGHLPPIPTQIAGTLAHPSVVPDVSQLPLETLRLVFYGVEGTAKAIGNAVGSGVRSVGKGLKRVFGGRRDEQDVPDD